MKNNHGFIIIKVIIVLFFNKICYNVIYNVFFFAY